MACIEEIGACLTERMLQFLFHLLPRQMATYQKPLSLFPLLTHSSQQRRTELILIGWLITGLGPLFLIGETGLSIEEFRLFL